MRLSRHADYWLPLCVLALAVPFESRATPQEAEERPKPQPTLLRILVPTRDAEVYVLDELIEGSGLVRELEAPALEAGVTSFDVKISFPLNNYTTITRNKTLRRRADGSYPVTVNMRKADSRNPDHIAIRYVVTPMAAVRQMLKMAEVGEGDVVFDLGCGDGRMVIEAVYARGATRGVGVDFDPERIIDSRKRAAEFGVSDRVEFREGDVLEAIPDLRDASVVMLYMGEAMNQRLMPILQKALKPGARVVSHRFSMGNLWKPEKALGVRDPTGAEKYKLFLWQIGEPEQGYAPSS
jgi:precorrin-6B methylase 2